MIGDRRRQRQVSPQRCVAAHLVLVVPTLTATHHPGDGMGELSFFRGWDTTFVDPAPGTYRWTTDVTWADASSDDELGDGRVDLELVLVRRAG